MSVINCCRIVEVADWDGQQVPISPFDNALAVDQMEVAYATLLDRQIVSKTPGKNSVLGIDGYEHPRIVRSAAFYVFFGLFHIWS